MGGAKLTVSPEGEGGEFNKAKSPWVKCFSVKNPPDIHLKNCASLDILKFQIRILAKSASLEEFVAHDC